MYLTVDLGSTRFKAALFTADLTRVGDGEARIRFLRKNPYIVKIQAKIAFLQIGKRYANS
jgi:sugar (pentulose or hexulose) kinase